LKLFGYDADPAWSENLILDVVSSFLDKSDRVWLRIWHLRSWNTHHSFVYIRVKYISNIWAHLKNKNQNCWSSSPKIIWFFSNAFPISSFVISIPSFKSARALFCSSSATGTFSSASWSWSATGKRSFAKLLIPYT